MEKRGSLKRSNTGKDVALAPRSGNMLQVGSGTDRSLADHLRALADELRPSLDEVKAAIALLPVDEIAALRAWVSALPHP